MSKTDQILVSVIVPCYNDGAYISDALRSVREQSFKYWECIVVNDGSTDNTTEIVQDFCDKDARFRLISIANSGPSVARNTGIQQAEGIYILPLDADDTISANYLSACIELFEEQGKLTLVYGREVQQKENFKEPGAYSWDKLLFHNMIHCAGMYRKADWERTGGYDAAMLFGFEDWEFWLRLLAVQGQVARATDAVLFVRAKPASRTSLMQEEQMVQMRRKIYAKHADLYNHFFTDPIELYNRLYVYEASFKDVKKRPFYFAFSQLIKKRN